MAARDLPAGARIGGGALGVRRVPARFAPPDALASGAEVRRRPDRRAGRGGRLPHCRVFEGGEAAATQYGLRRGERAVTVEVAGGLADAGPAPGARVDVLVSTEGPGGGRTQMALAGAELLGVGEAAAADSAPDASQHAGPTALATLRVSVRQAIYLTAADNFAREIRLLLTPARRPHRAPEGSLGVSRAQL